MHLLFKERQYFRQTWLWVTLCSSTLLTIGLPLLLGGFSLREEPGLILIFLLPAALLALFAMTRLDTEIRQDGVYCRFFPFQRKYRVYSREQIADARIRKYDPLGEYGGWGIKGTRRNRAWNVSGNQGLQLVLDDGRKVLIGTQQPARLEEALNAAGSPLLKDKQ